MYSFFAEFPKGLPLEIKINHFLSEFIPYINSGNMPDLKNLAAKHGIDPDEAREIYKQVK